MTDPEHPVGPIERRVGERQNVLVATSTKPPPAVGNPADSGEGSDHSRADHHRQHNLTPARTVASEIMFERGDAHAAQRSDSDCCGCHEHTRLRNAERENTVHGDQSEAQATRATNQRRTASSKRQARPTSRGTVMGMANAQVSAAESGPIAKRRRSVSGSVDASPVRPSANGCQEARCSGVRSTTAA